MVYGITNRGGWTEKSPYEIWKFWDKYQLKDKIMVGYWEKDCPVTCSNPVVKASVFMGRDEIIVAVANWTDLDAPTSLTLNWANLGMDPAGCDISIPELQNFQTEQTAVSLDKLTLPGKKGYLIVIKKKS